MEDRRDHGPYLAMLESFKRDIYEHMDRGFEDVKERIERSHNENREWQYGHAGPSADSLHGQEGAKRERHYEEHADFREKQFDPLVEKVNHAKWTLGGILLLFSAAWAAFLKWWSGQ